MSFQKEKHWWHQDINLPKSKTIKIKLTKQLVVGIGVAMMLFLIAFSSYTMINHQRQPSQPKFQVAITNIVINQKNEEAKKASEPIAVANPRILGEETATNTNQNNNTAQATNNQPVVEKQKQKTGAQSTAKPNVVTLPKKKSASLGYTLAAISLFFGLIFFLYAVKYYIVLVFILVFSKRNVNGNHNGFKNNFNGNGHNHTNGRLNGFFNKVFQNGHHFVNHYQNGNGQNGKNGSHGQNGAVGLMPNLENIIPSKAPFFSVHLPFYNERKVVDRILTACTSFDYPNYEVIVIDDSTDETTQLLKKWQKHPRVKVIHREARTGFKGGALQVALGATHPKAEFITVFDADFIPYPDTLNQFLKYFLSSAINGNGNHKNGKNNGNGKSNGHSFNYAKSMIAAVQGYQWHVLNKGENWITKSIRSEFAGSYVIERPGTELFGSLKQIAGSVFMIRADVLKKYGWGTSITEDFELTLKLYQDGYKVIYTPYIQGPSECVASLSKLIKQRMRWAEGHTHNIRKYIWKILFSKKLVGREKVEFFYLAPYYLQAAFFLVGTLAWFASDAILHTSLPFWTALWGWSLVLTNLLALPLINSVGLFLEESPRRDYLGIFSFMFLIYVMVPFQAYAALRGLFKKDQSPWFRTPKTGHITDAFYRSHFRRWFGMFLPGPRRRPRSSPAVKASYLKLTTANNKFQSFKITSRLLPAGWKNAMVSSLLLISITIGLGGHYLVPDYRATTNNFKLVTADTASPVSANNIDYSGFNAIDNPVMMTPNLGEAAKDRSTQYVFHQNPRVRVKQGLTEIEFITKEADGLGKAKESGGRESNGQALYPNVFPGIDLRYTMISKGLLEEFIVNEPKTFQGITQELKIKDVEVITPPGQSPVFADKKTKDILFKLDEPKMYELNNQVEESQGLQYKLEPQDNDYKLAINITSEGQKWLADPNRSYPVAIDPSVIVTDGVNEAEAEFGGNQTKLVYSTTSSKWYAVHELDALGAGDGYGDIYFYTSSNGTSWDATIVSDEIACSGQNSNPSMTMAGSLIYVVWNTRNCKLGNDDDLIYRTINTASSDGLGTACSAGDQGTIGGNNNNSIAVVGTNVFMINDNDPDFMRATTSCGTPTAVDVTHGVTATDRPVLVTFGSTLHVFFQDGNLSWSRCADGVCDGAADWTVANNNIAANSNAASIFSVTTDGSSIYVLALSGASPATAAVLYGCVSNGCDATGDWTTYTTPFTSKTNLTSVSLTWDTTNTYIYAHGIMDSSEQAYWRSTASNIIPLSWETTYSYGFTAGNLGHISAPMTVTAASQVGVVLRQGTNFEFATIPERVIALLGFALILPLGIRWWRWRKSRLNLSKTSTEL